MRHRVSVIDESIFDGFDNDTKPRESTVERSACRFAEERGWWESKFTAPGLRGVQDRIFIRHGVVLFVEFKRPGEALRAQQSKRRSEMIAHGAKCFTIDNLDDAKKLFR